LPKSIHKENEHDYIAAFWNEVTSRVITLHGHVSAVGEKALSANDSYPIPHGVGVFQHGSFEKLNLSAGKQEVCLPLLYLYSVIMDSILKP